MRPGSHVRSTLSTKPKKRDRTAAERMRRYRIRLAKDVMVLRQLEVDFQTRSALVERGYLSERSEDDPKIVERALSNSSLEKRPLCPQ